MAEGAEGVAPVLPKSITSFTSLDGDTTTRTTFYTTQGSEHDARRTKEAEDYSYTEEPAFSTSAPLLASLYATDNDACGRETIHSQVSSMRAELDEVGTRGGLTRETASSRQFQTPGHPQQQSRRNWR